ncbi:MAG: hypothetical protein GEV10_04450 [Streptosporangiales bacterium]|nr:hypothetical protein [Streptosporangiales bacterium]
MKKHLLTAPVAGLFLAGLTAVLAAPAASAHPGHEHPSTPATPVDGLVSALPKDPSAIVTGAVPDPAGLLAGQIPDSPTGVPQHGEGGVPVPPADPTAAPSFFLAHLDTYHVGQPLLGFVAPLENPQGWADKHLIPTVLETGARAVKPVNPAPPVDGDTWQDNSANPGPIGGEVPHGDSSLTLVPVEPTAGAEFFVRHLNTYHFGKPLVGFGPAINDPQTWADKHLIPTALEVGYRTLKPVNPAPTVRADPLYPDAQSPGGHDGGSTHRSQATSAKHADADATSARTGSVADAADTTRAVQETATASSTATKVTGDTAERSEPRDQATTGASDPLGDATRTLKDLTQLPIGPAESGQGGE